MTKKIGNATYRHAHLKYKIQQQKSWFEKNFYAQHLSFSTKIVNKSKATTTFLCDQSILEKKSTHINQLVLKKSWHLKDENIPYYNL